ncbi:MAG: hypothetical protein WAN92_07765 [Herbaspirillum sp.]
MVGQQADVADGGDCDAAELNLKDGETLVVHPRRLHVFVDKFIDQSKDAR